MGQISIANIILHGNQNETVDLTGVSTCLVLDKSGGNLDLTVTGDVCMRGTINGILTLWGNGNVTLCGNLSGSQLILDNFTGTFDDHGFLSDFGPVIWLFVTNMNFIDPISFVGGIR
jgi:hypothetical protein